MSFIKKMGEEIKQTVLKKQYGFYVALAAWVLTIAYTISYAGAPDAVYNSGVVVSGVSGILLFVALSLFRKTSQLAPLVLMVCSLLSVVGFVGADGAIDYLTTEFFDGFSMDRFLSLPASVWFSLIAFILSFVIASAAMYMPQNKQEEQNAAQIEEGEAAQ